MSCAFVSTHCDLFNNYGDIGLVQSKLVKQFFQFFFSSQGFVCSNLTLVSKADSDYHGHHFKKLFYQLLLQVV